MILWRRMPEILFRPQAYTRGSLMARRRCQICHRRPGERVLCVMGCGKMVGPGCCLFAELPHRVDPNNQRAGCCVKCRDSFNQNQCQPEPMPEPMPTDLDALNFAGEELRHTSFHILNSSTSQRSIGFTNSFRIWSMLFVARAAIVGGLAESMSIIQ